MGNPVQTGGLVSSDINTSSKLKTIITDEVGAGSYLYFPLSAGVIYSATKTLSKDGTGADGAIVGTGAGALGHSAGVTLVAAQSGKVIVPIFCLVNYTRTTASYTGGNSLQLVVGSTAMSGTVSAANGFASGSSKRFGLSAPTAYNTLTPNSALFLFDSGGFTDPGTAAGTATVTVSYRLIDE